MDRTEKQSEFYDAIMSGKYLVFFLGGGTGSGKTIPALNFIHTFCKMIPGVRIPIYRKSEKILKNNTIPSFRKVLALNDEKIPIVDMKARYPNGSEVLFLWADISKDPDCDNAKGGEWTGAMFDEVNQMDKKYFDVTKTRVGRWNNIEVPQGTANIKPFIIVTCNPTNNWVKEEFYDKYRVGALPDNVFFQLSLPKDNPFLSEDYIESLESLPDEEYQRYVLGNWDYNDDVNSLVKYEWLKNCSTNREYQWDKDKIEYLGIDVARYGNDSTIFSNVQDGYFYGFKEFRKQDTVETYERAVLEMEDKSIGAERVGIDVIGLGGGVVDNMIHKGYPVTAFNSAQAPMGTIPFYEFGNLRAEVFWRLRDAIKKEEIEIRPNDQLFKELTNIQYIIKDKKIYIEKKEDIKKRLGYSPDYADAMAIAFYVSRMKESGSYVVDEEDMVHTIGGNLMLNNL